MRPELKTKLFIAGSVVGMLGLLLLVLFVDVLFPVEQEDVAMSGPSLGMEPKLANLSDAPVTIVEFSDFQCPFCRQALPTLKRIKAVYGDKVMVVYRHFPITTIHPRAAKAAEAAECAGDQGKFWAYHDLLFESQALEDDDLLDHANSLGLDAEEFKRCLDSGIKRTVVQRDLNEGMELGLRGTPIFFINGKRLEGAQPYAAFKEIIDAELAGEKEGGGG